MACACTIDAVIDKVHYLCPYLKMIFQVYLHHLVAHPAKVSPFGGFLPQQVMGVAAVTVLTIQTQHHPTHGQEEQLENKWTRNSKESQGLDSSGPEFK